MAKTNQEQKDEREREKVEPINWQREALSWVIIFVIAIAAAFFINKVIIVNATVPTGSMENTIIPGDRIIGLRFSYWFSEPKRGDIVIFKFPDDESENYVKRVVGLPGETIKITGGQIYIDGEPWEDGHAKENWDFTSDEEYVVPENSYFMMGDNRNDSLDSRYWDNKYVHRDKILGKAVLCYWPVTHWSLLD